jgi:muramoyltetrapeptide carboxypeptidase
MVPSKLKIGDEVRIVTPARSLNLPWINEDIKTTAKKRLESLGLKVTFGKHVNEVNHFNSSDIKLRVQDLHDAFRDKNVKIILTVIGGFNSNEILPYLDYELIKKNPKILCGYSDITALENAIYAKTNMMTYSGPHFFDFGEKKNFEYAEEYFKKCLFSNEPFEIKPSDNWSEDRWGKDQENRILQKNSGMIVLNEGHCEGHIVGSNLVTFLGLAGTQYFPSLKDKVLFLEEDHEEHLYSFNRNITTLTLMDDFKYVKGIVFGRFQSESKISINDLKEMIKNNQALQKIPIIAGLDFGHTNPRLTFPIGGKVVFDADNNSVSIKITEH